MSRALKKLPVSAVSGKLFRTGRVLSPVALILVRYGEIGLKGTPVRRRFEHLLVADLQKALAYHGAAHSVSTTRGRIFVEVDGPEEAGQALRRVFGITSFSPVEEVPAELPSIAAAAVEAADMGPGESFAIRASRTGSHAFTSQEVAVVAGQAVVDATGAPVNLDHPDREIFVEVREQRAFVFTQKIPGPGGLPYGSQGRVVAIIEDEEGLQAAWLMMRRGCTIIGVCPPALAPRVKNLYPWQDIPVEECRGELLRRAEEVAADRGAEGLVTSRQVVGGQALPVFYPLLGYWAVQEAKR